LLDTQHIYSSNDGNIGFKNEAAAVEPPGLKTAITRVSSMATNKYWFAVGK